MHSLERIRFRLVRRHHDPLLVLSDHVAVDGNDVVEFIRHDLHLVTGDVHPHSYHVILHGLCENCIRLIDVITGHEGPLIGHHEWNHAVVQGDQDLRVDCADLCKERRDYL